jgi:hypothetical protein
MLDGPSRRSSIVGETYATKQEARPSGGRTFGSYSGTNGGDVGGKWKLLGMLTFVWDVLPSASLLCPRYAPGARRRRIGTLKPAGRAGPVKSRLALVGVMRRLLGVLWR